MVLVKWHAPESIYLTTTTTRLGCKADKGCLMSRVASFHCRPKQLLLKTSGGPRIDSWLWRLEFTSQAPAGSAH